MNGGGFTAAAAESSPAPEDFPAMLPDKAERVNLGVDFYAQAVKTLSERSPYDSEEVLANTSSSLPSELARLLIRPSDSRRKRKRSSNDDKSTKKASEKTSIWFEFDDYFKELTLQDIDRLFRLSSSFSSLESSNLCFSRPELGNVDVQKVENRNANELPAGDVALVENNSVLKPETVKKVEDEDGDSVSVIDRVLKSGTVEITKQSVVKKVENKDRDSASIIDRVLEPETVEITRQSVVKKLEDEDRDSVIDRVLKSGTLEITKQSVVKNVENKDRDSVSVIDRVLKSGTLEITKESVVKKVENKDRDSVSVIDCVLMSETVEFTKQSIGKKIEDEDMDSVSVVEQVSGPLSSTQSCSSIEWVLGSRNRVLLTSTRPTKKRKLLGENAGLERLMVAHPYEGSSGLCHVCSIGDTRDQLNKLVVCTSCKVVVHQKCYGIQGDVNESWVCALCKHKSVHRLSGDIPCVLCPKSGGALKQFQRVGCDGVVEFAHLFCGQWIPQVYVDDTRMMEPLLFVEGMKDVRGKSVCSLCKVQLGYCIRCSDGSCRAVFHPICAREARNKLEIWGKFGCDDIELRAFCAKHSGDRSVVGLDTLEKHELVNTVGSDKLPHSAQQGSKIKKLIIGLKNGDKVILGAGAEDSTTICSEDHLSQGVTPKDTKSNTERKSDLQEFGEVDSPGQKFNLESVNPSDVESIGAEVFTSPEKSSVVDLDQELPCSISTIGYCDGDLKSEADSFVHPYVQKRLEEVQCLLDQKTHPQCGTEVEISVTDPPPTGNISTKNDVEVGYGRCGVNLVDVRTAEELGVLDLSPENELEGEIMFSQELLSQNAAALKHYADKLICKAVKSLPCEIDAVRKRKWDDVLVNQYVYEVNEARKQSRKERRHKEAQAVLAAATEAAAASPRVSLLRKDAIDESSQQQNQLKVQSPRSRGRPPLQPVARPKVVNPSFDVPDAMSEGYTDMFQYNSGSPKEHLKSCDICRRVESSLNPILVCVSCKVAVHLNCYRGVKEFTGAWYCELCEDSSLSKTSRDTIEKPHPIAECGLCGGSNGAFRKSSSGQWIHAFCAEWVLDSTFRRGQVFPVAGLEKLLKGNDICCVCHRRFGACIKCNYGSCRATYHPSCARSAGYYMNIKYVSGGKMQRRAYCSKHSLEQKTKAETRKHSLEDLKIAKQQRVELEKLRLLCERIVKREKLKRESVLCNRDVLASRRDSMVVSMLTRRPFWTHDGSSESATTSLETHSRPWSEAMQKSDDVTIDSALSSTLCTRLPLSVHNDQKTDDSSTSQRIPTPKPIKTSSFAGKQIPVRGKMTDHSVSSM